MALVGGEGEGEGSGGEVSARVGVATIIPSARCCCNANGTGTDGCGCGWGRGGKDAALFLAGGGGGGGVGSAVAVLTSMSRACWGVWSRDESTAGIDTSLLDCSRDSGGLDEVSGLLLGGERMSARASICGGREIDDVPVKDDI